MSPADLDLARELRARLPETVYDLSESWVVDGAGRRVVRGRLAGMRFVVHPRPSQWVPDLDDPATAGVLLAMLRHLTEHVTATVVYAGGWQLCADDREYEGPTLAVAAARALLAAWGPA